MPNNSSVTVRKIINSTPESYALNIIANMLVYFKYGESDGLTDNDIWDSFNELRESPVNKKDIPDSLMISMGQAMRVFGEERRKNIEGRRDERLANIEKVQQATAEKKKAVESNKKFSDSSKITIGALYAEAEMNDGYLYAKEFSEEFWNKIISYREMVHRYLSQIDETDNVLYQDASERTDRIYFVNPYYQTALEYGSITKYASRALKYKALDDSEFSLLYKQHAFDENGGKINLGCYVLVGSNETRGDNNNIVLADGAYATLNGIIIDDGTNRPSYYEQMLGIGLGLEVKVEDESYSITGVGSLLFDYGYKYTEYRVNNADIFSPSYDPFDEQSDA